MSESNKLTIEDPVSKESLAALEKLEAGHLGLASRLAELELEKIQVMIRLRAIMEERNRLIERELVERGLSPTTTAQIDDETGKITVLRPADASPQA
jgi:hypothetical protein